MVVKSGSFNTKLNGKERAERDPFISHPHGKLNAHLDVTLQFRSLTSNWQLSRKSPHQNLVFVSCLL
jgi:hypothetical protein